MALNNYDKNLLIATMERSVNDAKEAAGITLLSEIETAVSDLRSAFESDPATVTAATIVAAATMITACTFPTLNNIRDVLREAESEAGTV